MSLMSRARAATERIDRAIQHLPKAVEHLEDEADELAAQTFDPINRSNVSSVLVCVEHDQDLSECHRMERTCTIADPVAVHNDPTGEAAVSHSRPRALLSELDHKLHTYEKLAHWFDDFVFDNAPRSARVANPVESRKAQQENAKPPGCELCAAVEKWSAPHTANPTDVGGVLEQARRLCSPHYDFVRTRHRLPSLDEDQHYARKGKWPKLKETDRFVVGLHTGSLSQTG